MRTVTARSEIDELFSTGKRGSGSSVSVIVLPTPTSRGPEGRVMFVAGKRLGGAVLRNRSKRVMRAAVRRVGGPWPGFDVVLVARPATAAAEPAALDSGVRRALRHAGVLK